MTDQPTAAASLLAEAQAQRANHVDGVLRNALAQAVGMTPDRGWEQLIEGAARLAARAGQAEQEVTDMTAATVHLTTLMGKRAKEAEDERDRVQQAACSAAEALRKAEARVAELEAERKKDAAITARIDAQTEEQINGATEVAQYYKALADRTQAWGEQHRDRANRYRTRADAVRAELAALNSETAGLNPYAMAGRRDAVARIRAALQSISYDTPVPDDPRVAALEAENARLRAAWTSARARVKRAKRNRDGELRWANNMWSDALRDLHRYRQAWKSARHRAAMYLQSNNNFSASLHNGHAAWLQLQAGQLADRKAIERVQALAETWRYTSDRKHGPLRELRAALDRAQQPTGE